MKNNSCHICAGKIDEVFDLGFIPAMDNILVKTYQDAIKVPQARQKLGICRKCGFVMNMSFDSSLIKYDEDYSCERVYSDYYKTHMDNVSEEINHYKPINNSNILEVACGTGEFLKNILSFDKFGKPKKILGIDPSAKPIKDCGFEIISKEFNDEYVKNNKNTVDILINRHMIEHIEDPTEMLKMFSQMLSDDGILYLETPSLDWILENKVFFDFPYEHCSYFTEEFMLRLLNYTGFEVLNISRKYDGQYLSAYARKKQILEKITEIDIYKANDLKTKFSKLCSAYDKYKNLTIPSSDVCIWGASAKGCMWVNIFDKSGKYMVADINERKQNKYIPCTGNKILSPKSIISTPPEKLL